MKYRNKDTGVIVEAMQIEYSCQDILNFGDGLIRSIQSTGLLSRRMDTFDIEIGREYTSPWHCICKTGDYLVKKDTSIFALCEKEFKKCFELVMEENNMKDKEYTIQEVFEFPIGTKFVIDAGMVKIISNENNDNCNKLVLIDEKGNICDCILTNLWMDKKFKLVEADERTITKDTINDKAVPNIDINIYGEKDSQNVANDVAKALKENLGKYFNPVENATATLKTHERTVRDCILDELIKERASKLQESCILYLENLIKQSADGVINGFSYDTEEYKKFTTSLNKMRDTTSKDFIKIKEKDLKKMLGFNVNIKTGRMIYEIEQSKKREKVKE